MKRAIRIGGGIFCLMLLALAGCASTQVTLLDETTTRLPRPDRILVYDFAVSPDEVKLDRGISAKIAGHINETPRTVEEKAVGHRVASSVSEHLVENIRALGLFAEKAAGPPPRGGNIVEIEGQLISIDEGNKIERTIIGLGAGRTDVKTYVQVYDSRKEPRILAAEYQVDTDADGKRTAEEIVKMALGPFFVSQGWIPQSKLQEKGFFEKLIQ